MVLFGHHILIIIVPEWDLLFHMADFVSFFMLQATFTDILKILGKCPVKMASLFFGCTTFVV